MSPVGPSVDGGYRGSRDNATRGDHFSHGGYWDPLVRGYGPVNVFNDEEIDTKINKVDQNNSRRRDSNNRNNSNNDRNNNNNDNEDRRKDDSRHNNNRSKRNLARQQRGS